MLKLLFSEAEKSKFCLQSSLLSHRFSIMFKNYFMKFIVLLAIFCMASAFQHRLGRIYIQSALRLADLTTGEFEHVKISKVNEIADNFGKFKVEATIKSSEMNEFLKEYMEEMKRRKVNFPGFRPGKLPPYVMGDVRRYLVCFGLETMLGELCNLNGLKVRIAYRIITALKKNILNRYRPIDVC